MSIIEYSRAVELNLTVITRLEYVAAAELPR